jgi:hypothetical protein
MAAGSGWLHRASTRKVMHNIKRTFVISYLLPKLPDDNAAKAHSCSWIARASSRSWSSPGGGAGALSCGRMGKKYNNQFGIFRAHWCQLPLPGCCVGPDRWLFSREREPSENHVSLGTHHAIAVERSIGCSRRAVAAACQGLQRGVWPVAAWTPHEGQACTAFWAHAIK